MFEHLDDPDADGFAPDAAFRTGVHDRVRRRLRRRRLAATAASLGLVIAAGVGVATVVAATSRVRRVHVMGLAPEPRGSAPYLVLLAGTDGGSAPLPAPETQPGAPPGPRSRADTIVLLRVDPAARRVTTLALPRDLWGSMAGGGSDRINQVTGSALVQTIRLRFHLEVQHYVELGFTGTRDVIDAFGGARLAFARPARDRMSGFATDTTGCQTISGAQTLSLARSRHFESFDGRFWQGDASGDLGRVQRQQIIGRALVDALRRLDPTSPSILRTAQVMARNLLVDSGFGVGDLVRLARQIRSAELTTITLPVAAAVHDGKQTLDPLANAQATVDAFAAGRQVPAGPTGVWPPPPALPTPC
ncbi:MAG: cell envelope-related transcriptional attenuator [Acidimicrobiales bacterium]|nr:cell envelope-related transcriptional attenuator [Acidimicrobiales bacterium]